LTSPCAPAALDLEELLVPGGDVGGGELGVGAAQLGPLRRLSLSESPPPESRRVPVEALETYVAALLDREEAADAEAS
jgi:hypothetical protein